MKSTTKKEIATMVLDRLTKAVNGMPLTFACENDRGFFAGSCNELRGLLAELLDCEATGSPDDFAERLASF